MACKATRINMILGLLLAFFYALVFSSKVSAQTMEVNAYPKRSVSFELKPISLLANIIPGSRGFAGEFEASLGRNISVVAGLSHLRFTTPDAAVAEQRAEDKNKEIEYQFLAEERGRRGTQGTSLGARLVKSNEAKEW